MNIVIFEDDEVFAYRLEQSIRAHTHNPSALNTADAAKILQYIRTKSDATLFFLDILAKGEPVGFGLADAVANAGRECWLVVYITAFPDRLWGNHLYLTGAFTQIDKHSPRLEAEVRDTIDLAQARMDKRCLTISNQGERHRIPFDEIFYIEKLKSTNKVRIVGEFLRIDTYDTLENLMNDQLRHTTFVRCHRSFIVNTGQVRSKRGNELFFKDGSSCVTSLLHFLL